MAGHESLLRVEGLSVSYGAVEAVRDLTLEVSRGEIVALLGSNGAGKSSTLKALMGLARCRGQVHFKGGELRGAPPEARVKRGMALVPEGREVFASLTVAENLVVAQGALVSKPSGSSRWDVETVAELFPILRERRHQPAGMLSGGEQQQLAIARALLSDPELLLLDEPSLGLAPKIVDRIFDLLRELRDRGLTILLVEQDVHRALDAADRGYVLEHGSLTLSGSAAELQAAEESLIGAYLGSGGRTTTNGRAG